MTEPSLTQRKKGVTGCALAVVAVCATMILLVCLYWVWTVRCEREFSRQLEELRERGEPTTAEELEAFYALPKGAVDTTQLWVMATTMFDSEAFAEDSKSMPRIGDADYAPPAVEEGWEQLEEVEAFLDRYREEIQLMHEAAARGGAARYETDYAQGFLMLLVEVQRLRNASRMLALDARVQAHRRQPEKVHESLEAMVRVAESLKEEPILVSQLVRVAMLGVAVHATSEAIHDVEFDDEQLRQLQMLFRSIEVTKGFQRAVMGERCMGIHYLHTENFSGQDLGVSGANALLLKLIKQDTEEYLSIMGASVEAVGDESYASAQVKLNAIEDSITSLRGPQHTVSRLLLPAFNMSSVAKARTQAYLRMTDAGLAVQRYRLANGELPKNLDALVPDYLPQVPMDPFDQNPLRYVIVDEKTFFLYSIGEDGVDDGGVDANNKDYFFGVGVKSDED